VTSQAMSGWGMYAVPGTESPTVDLLAILRDSPREGSPRTEIDLDTLAHSSVVFASSFGFDFQQKADASKRFAGEGEDSNTFSIPTATIGVSIKMPLAVTSLGWLDPAFLHLYHLASAAAQGSPTSAMSKLIPQDQPSDFLQLESVEDFASIIGVDWGGPVSSNSVTPVQALILDPAEEDPPPAVTVTHVDKHARRLYLSQEISHDYSEDTIVVVMPDAPGAEFPCFTLVSLREGVIGPCMVNKLTVECTPKGSVAPTIEIKALKIDRNQQPKIVGLRDYAARMSSVSAPVRHIEGDTCKLSLLSPGGASYGLSGPPGDPLFGGFQSLALPNLTVTSFGFTIDNRLKESHALHSLEGSGRANAFPFAMYSEGRVVSGTIRYRSPIAPIALSERLSAHSGINGGGLEFQIGSGVFRFRDVVWAPSQSSGDAGGDQDRTLEWMGVAETLSALEPIGMKVQL
jgi:hypothetical protein